MRAVSIVGAKNVGKTALGIALAQELASRGLKVTALKHSHHGFDKADTDTERYGAHCIAVGGIGPKESFISWPGGKPFNGMAPLLESDFLIVEGGKSLGCLPRILVMDEIPDEGIEWLNPELAIAVYGTAEVPGLPNITNVAELASHVLQKGFLLPGLDCGACDRENCAGLAADVVSGTASVDDCDSLGTDMEITVNGTPIALNPFVRDFMGATLKAMLEQLKGFSPGTVKISMKA